MNLENIIEKIRVTFSKDTYFDGLIFLLLSIIFILLDWRLFVYGSGNQLFIYGDLLTYLNNLYYLFENFDIRNIFGTFIGKNGMMGNYMMAVPGSSLFYPGIFLLLPVYKLFHLSAYGLYYITLFAHLIHFVVGAFFIYKIASRVFGTDKRLAFFGSLIYLGFGWNVTGFGVNLIGLIPPLLFVFLRYLQLSSRLYYLLFVGMLSMFLYSGAIVNFFFYFWFNGLIIFSLAIVWRIEHIIKWKTYREILWKFILLFVIAPFWSLAIYAVQLVSTYMVSSGTARSIASYDSIAFFGNRFSDLVGLVIPSFGMLYFGAQTNTQVLVEFATSRVIYIGIIPIIVIFLALYCLKNKVIASIAILTLVNFMLTFGGVTFLYDLTYFFPGNSLFRGHGKYITFVGVYIALLVPLVLHALHAEERGQEVFRKFRSYGIGLGFVMFVFALISIFASFLFALLQGGDSSMHNYYNIGLTFSSYFFRACLFLALSYISLKVFLERKSWPTYLFLVFVLLLDLSGNYKYQMLGSTRVEDLVSRTFFKCCQDKTVVNNIDHYSQIYIAPELSGVDSIGTYEAMPNTYLTTYQQFLLDKKGNPNTKFLLAAGISGIITDQELSLEDYSLASTVKVNEDNFKRLFLYNATSSTSLHNDWGSRRGAIGKSIRYYSLEGSKKIFFASRYHEVGDNDDVLSAMKSDDFDPRVPVVFNENNKKKLSSSTDRDLIWTGDIETVVDTPTNKKYKFVNTTDGFLFINIPYLNIWKARVNGVEVPIYRTNYAFSGIKMNGSDEKNIEFFVDLRMVKVGAFISVVAFVMLIGGVIRVYRHKSLGKC